MVSRQRAEFRRQLCATDVRKLLCVQLDRQAQSCRAIEHARDLRCVKGDPFAEPVHGIYQALGMGGLKRRQTDFINIHIRLGTLWHGVRAEKAGANGDGAL